MDRVYLILNITADKHIEAVNSLQANPGVRWVDVLEGQWDIITAIESSNRMRLAKHLIQALASVEAITEDLQVLPTNNGYSIESKVEPVGIVKNIKAKNPKQAKRNRNASNTPN